MTTAKKIKQMVSGFPDDFVFVVSDLDCDFSQREAAARALQRMAERGDISKLTNGRYFKPRMTVFGKLKPSPAQIVKEYLVKDGETIGYLTGGAVFSRYSLTTQISSEIRIGTNKYRRPLERAGYRITFVVQPNPISGSDIEMLGLLDCLRFIREIPATTPDEACRRIKSVVGSLDDGQRARLSQYAISYAPYVRALSGAILEAVGAPEAVTAPLKQSLNGVSKYKLPISETVLPNKLSWRIYESPR